MPWSRRITSQPSTRLDRQGGWDDHQGVIARPAISEIWGVAAAVAMFAPRSRSTVLVFVGS